MTENIKYAIMLLLVALCYVLIAACGVMAFVAAVQAEGFKRDPKARAEFVRTHPCPAPYAGYGTKCPGWVVDHIVPLCAGGADKPFNMQWQEVEESYKKDRAELALCKWIREAYEAHGARP